MNKFANGVELLLATVWIGGLWGIGFLAVPVLFQAQPDKILAGMLAGKMFSSMAYVGMFSAGLLLLHSISQFGLAAFKQKASIITVTMLILTLIMQFGIQPIMTDLKTLALPAEVMHSTYADRFKMLHGISSTLYLMQSLLGALLILGIKRN